MAIYTPRYFSGPSGLSYACALLLVGSILISPFLLSLSMWGLVAAALWQARNEVKDRNPQAPGGGWWGAWGYSFRRFFEQPRFWLMAFLLIVPATSYFWSDNTGFWASQTRVRLPFFVLPWAFANLPLLEKRQYQLVLYWLVVLMFLLCIGVGVNFALQYQSIIDDLNHGRPVPVPRNHIRFSLLLATAIVSGGWLWQQRFVYRYAWERHLLAGMLVVLFLFIHLLTVRSAIGALYAGLFFSVVYIVIRTRSWKLGLIASALLLTMPMVAYVTMPSVQQRIRYMIYDYQKYKSNIGGDYSDAQRWVSLNIGMLLFRESPVLGVGAGDLRMEVQSMANDRFPNYSIDPKLPHNQYIYIAAGTGLLGLALSLLALLAPFLLRAARRFYLFLTFQVMVFVSFLVEYTLETAIGVAFYLFFTLWFAQLGKVSESAS